MSLMDDETRKMIENMTGRSVDDVHEGAIQELADKAKAWQGNSHDDKLARAMIGNMRRLMDDLRAAAETDEPVNQLVFQVAVRQYVSLAESVEMLGELGKLRHKPGE